MKFLFSLYCFYKFMENPKDFMKNLLEGFALLVFFFANLLIIVFIEENTAIVFDHPFLISFASMIVEVIFFYGLSNAYKSKDDALLLSWIKYITSFIITFLISLIIGIIHPYFVAILISSIYGCILISKYEEVKNSNN